MGVKKQYLKSQVCARSGFKNKYLWYDDDGFLTWIFFTKARLQKLWYGLLFFNKFLKLSNVKESSVCLNNNMKLIPSYKCQIIKIWNWLEPYLKSLRRILVKNNSRDNVFKRIIDYRIRWWHSSIMKSMRYAKKGLLKKSCRTRMQWRRIISFEVSCTIMNVYHH